MGGTVTPAAHTIAAILTDAARLGIKLQAHGDKLRYRPRDRMTPDLAERLKTHKQALLALLRANSYTDAERTILADAALEPGAVPLVDAVKATFADLGGAEVVGVQPDTTTLAEQQGICYTDERGEVIERIASSH